MLHFNLLGDNHFHVQFRCTAVINLLIVAETLYTESHLHLDMLYPIRLSLPEIYYMLRGCSDVL